MLRRHLIAALALTSTALALPAIATQQSKPTPTAKELLAKSTPAEWRTPDPRNLIFLQLPTGRVVIEMAPDFPPLHTGNIRTLVREHYLAQLAILPSLDHRVYHVSAGGGACTFGELREAVIARHPELECIQPVGRGRRISDRARARLLRPLDAYLPFINAGVRYANDRFVSEAGAIAPSALTYVPELVGLITLREALDEMYQP